MRLINCVKESLNQYLQYEYTFCLDKHIYEREVSNDRYKFDKYLTITDYSGIKHFINMDRVVQHSIKNVWNYYYEVSIQYTDGVISAIIIPNENIRDFKLQLLLYEIN